jgi:hypothetical protein
MPNLQLHPEFRDQYEGTKYPFMDNATMVSEEDQAIDRDLFEDASLFPIGDTVGILYIGRIEVETRSVRIVIMDSNRVERCSAEFDPLFAPELLRLTDPFGRPAGILVSKKLKLARFTAWQIGSHLFANNAAQFVPSCVIPTPEVGIRGVMTEDGDLFVRDFLIVGDNGVVVREEEPGCIRVDIVGDPLFRRKLCIPVDLFTTPRFVKTINGCPSDQYGNINLTVGDHLNEQTILRIYPTNAGLTVEAAGANTQGLT